MKYKYLLFSVIVIIGILFSQAHTAYSIEQTPENFVREFYIWYSEGLNRDELPELDDEIYKYVCESTVDRLRIEHKMGSRDYNYFIDTNDNWPELFTYITTGKVVKINDDLSLVPLGFGETKARSAPHLIIFVQKGKNGLRIIKVDGLASEFYAPTRN